MKPNTVNITIFFTMEYDVFTDYDIIPDFRYKVSEVYNQSNSIIIGVIHNY